MSKFGVSQEDLSKFVRLCFDYPLTGQAKEKVLPVLKKWGGQEGLLKSLKADSVNGINPDEIEQRTEIFGPNKVEPEDPDTIWQMAWEVLEDECLRFLIFAAFVSFAVGLIFNEGMEWLEGIAILGAVGVVVIVSVYNDYQKDLQFRALSAINDDVKVTVIRKGNKERISTYDVVVGDVVLLSAGDMVCADGVVFEKNDLGISEASLTGESVLKKKGAFVFGDDADAAVKVSPAVFAGTLVQEGQGRMLVLAVGANTYQGLMESKMQEDEAEDTVLSAKLDEMTAMIINVGKVAAGVTIGVLFARFAFAFWSGVCCKEAWDHSIHHLEYLRFLVVGVTIFVVAVPEGLPLAVTITLSLTVGKMQDDYCLVRHMGACETMGSATTICSDKTGTLTSGKMTVVKVWSAGEGARGRGEGRDTPAGMTVEDTQVRLPQPLQSLLAEAVIINSSFKSDVEWNEKKKEYTNTGNDTECAMLVLANKLLQSQSKHKSPYRETRKKYPMEDPKRQSISFSSARKRMSTVVSLPNGRIRLYCKGASEIVLGLCTHVLRPDCVPQGLNDLMREELERIIGSFADEGLRTIAVAYRDFDHAPNIEDPDEVEEQLTLVALLGLEDPVRPEVPEAVATCKRAGIVVRMVTGDNPRTAVAIAKKCGILEEGDKDAIVMTGPDFRERVCDENDEIDQEEFDKIWINLRVLARSSPIDKLTLVKGIQNSKASVPQVVAVTGDGTNDAPALKRADIGFAMNSGTQVAWKASDIVIMNDNFASVVEAVKWGRCVYDNICKFLQFQLTVNLTACVIAVVGASILTKSPLNVIQLLWVNMIMDSFASLALATEDPKDDLLRRKPYPKTQQLLSPNMLRSLICHALYQLFVLFVVIFLVGDVCPGSAGNVCTTPVLHAGLSGPFGGLRSGRPAEFDKDFFASEYQTCVPVFSAADPKTYFYASSSASCRCSNVTGIPMPKPGYNGTCKITVCKKVALRSETYCKDQHATEAMPNQHNAIIFTVFVLLQLFNQINARKLHGEVNVFEGITENKYFLAMMGMEFFCQVVMVSIPGLNTAMGCASLSLYQWAVCIFIGATELLLNPLILMVPTSLIPKYLTGKEEEKADGIPLLSKGDKLKNVSFH